MWFDELMDDCKEGLKVVNENKGVFVPIFVNAGIGMLSIILIIVLGTLFAVFNASGLENIFKYGEMPSAGLMISAIILLGFVYLLLTVVKAIMEVGSINMYKAAIEGVKPRASHFFDGVRNYFFRVFGTTVLINAIIALLFLPLFLLFILYSISIGILTAGWGIILIFILIGVYFGTWTIAVVEDNKGGFEAIKTSVRFGKQHFWSLFIIALSAATISKYIAAAFGGVVALIAGWFFAAAVLAYFKVVLMIVYRRKKEQETSMNLE